MIEQLQGFPPNVLAFSCRGHVTREDYEAVLIPAVEGALRDHEKVRLYYEIGSQFEGIDAGAMVEDFKVGLAHLPKWERFAVVSDVAWIRNCIRAFGFVMPGKLRVFHADEAAAAKAWICEP